MDYRDEWCVCVREREGDLAERHDDDDDDGLTYSWDSNRYKYSVSEWNWW